MNTKKGLFLAAALFIAIVAVPLAAAHAAGPNTNVWSPSILKGPLITCTGNPTDASGNPNSNACTSLCDLISTIINIVYFAIGLVIWIIAPFSFVVAGVMYLVAGANPEMLGTAKKTILGAVIGLGIVLCSWLIINTFITVLGITGIGGFGSSACTVAAPPSSGASTSW